MKSAVRSALVLGPLFFLLPSCATLQDNPQKAQLYYDLGANLIIENKIPQAIVNLQQAYALDPSRFDIPMHLGLAYMRIDELKQSEKFLKEAERLQPDIPENLNNLAALYLKTKQAALAADYASRALKIMTYDTPELALANLAQAQDQLGQSQLAGESLKKAITRNPASCSVHLLYVRHLVHQNSYMPALKEAKISEQRCPFLSGTYIWQAYIYYKLGQWELAGKRYKHIIALFKHGEAVEQSRESLQLLTRQMPLPEPQS